MMRDENWVALALLLWSCVIGPEFPPDIGPGDGEKRELRVQKPLAPAKEKIPLQPLPRDSYEPIDKQSFIAAFKRQSHQELLPCLRRWRKSPQAVLMKAGLSRDGRLDQFGLVGDSGELPACAVEAMRKMSFRSVTQLMETDSQNIQWRLDW